MSAGGASAKTHVIKDELNPDFSEWSCALELDKYLTHADQLDDHELHIKVLDSDPKLGLGFNPFKDEVLGEAKFKVPADVVASPVQITLENETDKGAVMFNFRKTNREIREKVSAWNRCTWL